MGRAGYIPQNFQACKSCSRTHKQQSFRHQMSIDVVHVLDYYKVPNKKLKYQQANNDACTFQLRTTQLLKKRQPYHNLETAKHLPRNNLLSQLLWKTGDEILNEDSDTDEDEVFLPNDGNSFPSSSGGGGQTLEEDMLNAYDDYEDQFEEYPSSYQEFCDQFDFKVKGLGRRNRNIISYVEDLEGNPFHGNSVGEQFVSHFKNVLGKSSKVLPINDPSGLFHKKLSEAGALYMVRNISDDEIKKALFDIDGNKAPSPDGFSS
ncbi:hypothetical protein Tco_0832572 [Tanacetum coccineum]